MQTNQNQKEKLAEMLKHYSEKYGSLSKAANSLKGVSAAIISQILNGNWEQISDEMWTKIGVQIGYTSKELVIVQTNNYKALTKLLKDAALNSTVYAVIDNAGSSKTITTKHFAETNKQAYRIECRAYWNRKMFLSELLRVVGRDASGLNVNEMVELIVKTIKVQDSPVIILDEFDKLNDEVLYFFITLYNELQDECGIVACATDHLEKRIQRGLRLNKKGYKEIFSRFGRKFITLPGVNSTDIHQICLANGITSQGDIKEVLQDCEFDLRRVKRKIHALKNAA